MVFLGLEHPRGIYKHQPHAKKKIMRQEAPDWIIQSRKMMARSEMVPSALEHPEGTTRRRPHANEEKQNKMPRIGISEAGGRFQGRRWSPRGWGIQGEHEGAGRKPKRGRGITALGLEHLRLT